MTHDQLRSWSDEVLATSPPLWARGLPEVAQAVRELLNERDAAREQVRLLREDMKEILDNLWPTSIAARAIATQALIRDTAPEVSS